MNIKHVIAYFFLLTFGGMYVSALFWSGYFFARKILDHQAHERTALQARLLVNSTYGKSDYPTPW